MSEEQPADMLARLGSNGLLWAQEFHKTAVRLGYSAMDESWIIGWFANAIESSCNPLRNECDALRAELAAERERNEDLTTVYMCGFEKGKDAMRAELAAQADVHTQIQMQLSDERDTLRTQLTEARKELRQIEADCNADYPPSPGALKYAIRDVLKMIKGGKDEG